MWKQFVYNNSNYMIKFKTNSHTKLYLTDLKNIWLEEMIEDDLKQRFYSLNKFYAGGDVLNEISMLVNNLHDASINLTIEENIKFEISINKEYPLQFCWELIKQPSNIFFEELTLSLILTVQHLELQQQNLCRLLEKKDKEIQEYKREKGEISRDYLKTERFDKTSVCKENDNLLLNVVTDKSFVQTFTSNYDVGEAQIDAVKPTVSKKRKLKPYISKANN